MKPVYSTIAHLLQIESAQHLINKTVDRSNGLLSDEDVEEQLMRNIALTSVEWNGYVRGHMDLPIEPVIVELTGTMTFTNGSDIVVGTGTFYETEVEVEDWIQPQDNINAICLVREVTSDTQLRLTCKYYGATIPGGDSAGPKANIYNSGVPDEVCEMVTGYTCYRLWMRRGRTDDNNPFVNYKDLFLNRVKEIQTGKYRFHSVDAGEVAQKPSYSGDKYDGGSGSATYDITSDSMRGFYGDD